VGNDGSVTGPESRAKRRQFLKASAATVGALIGQGLLEGLPRSGSMMTYAFQTPQGTAGRKPDPISLSWFTTDFGTCSVRMQSQAFPNKPEVVVNIEGCIVGVLSGAFPPASVSRGDTNRVTNPFGVSVPFCIVKKVDEKRSKDNLELTLHGNFDKVPELPFVLKLRFVAEPYWVKCTAEILSLPPGVNLMAYCPDIQCEDFGAQNDPPFDMARQCFIFRKDKGFCWISDTERREAETQAEEGPWIQCFRTERFAQDRIDALLRAYKEDFGQLYGRPFRETEDVAACPLVGWVAKSDNYIIAVAGKNAYEVGTRWGPCLHSNMAAEVNSAGAYLPLESRIYILPPDRHMLLSIYRDHFEDRLNAGLFFPRGTLWPYTEGTLLGSFEGEDLASWRAEGGKLTPYASDAILTTRSNEPMRHDSRKRLWVNIIERTDGRHERSIHPEGVTEGKGSALWEVLPETSEARLSRELKLTEPLSHLALDAINRSQGDIEIQVIAESGRTLREEKLFLLRASSNRRLLVPLRTRVGPMNLTLLLKTKEHGAPTRIVLDNLRGFRVA
jgi:hypothetical protein